MNIWGKRTIKLAQKKDYLDQLYFVYPSEPESRTVAPETITSIRNAYEKQDNVGLLEKLLDLEKFPFKDSYISFLRTDRSAIKRNPKTVQRICSMLYEMGFDKMKEGIVEPKEANTRRGQQFRNWVLSSFSHLPLEEFVNHKKSLTFLEDSEKKILDFCNTKLGLALSKRPDFVAKSKGKYIVGEAKFLSSLGGNQGRGFDDAIKLATNPAGKAFKVAVIDGPLWIQPGSQEFKKIEYNEVCAFSALLLRKYLTSR